MSQSTVWTAEMEALLSTKTDVQIAKELSISAASVRRHRKDLEKQTASASIWTPEREALIGTMPDTHVAKKLGLTYEQVLYHRRSKGLPKFNDKRANNGGHSTAGHAGRKPVDDPKISKTVALTASKWAFLDDPKNGKSRGEIISRLIDEKQAD